MASMDIFSGDAFRTRELSSAIDLVPIQWGRIGALDLFPVRSVRTPDIMLESRNGVLSLIQSTERGAPVAGGERGKRKMRGLRAPHFAQTARITPDDIAGIRAFGSETELVQVADEVNERLIDLRANLDITIEYLRAGALAGSIRDADGSELLNLFTEFGVSEKSVYFDFAGSPDVAASCREVKRHIETTLLGDVMTGVHCLCSPGFFDSLMADAGFKDAHKYYESLVDPLRGDGRRGTPFQGITFEEYQGEAGVPNEDGTTTIRKFIADDEARFFPIGTRRSFQTFAAPADYMETVNTPGQLTYAKGWPDPLGNKYYEIEGQTNPLPICLQPAVLVRGRPGAA